MSNLCRSQQCVKLPQYISMAWCVNGQLYLYLIVPTALQHSHKSKGKAPHYEDA
jgi:hypothetical protein